MDNRLKELEKEVCPMKKHCRCGNKLVGDETTCAACKQNKKQTIESLEKFVKYGSFALAALSLVLKVVKDRES
jgi:predicted nucleic acid-binding Zn ribbon protein